MVGPRRPKATPVDPGRSAADAPPQSGNGDAPETSQVIQRTTPDRPAHQRANGAPPSGPAKLEPDEPAQRSRPVGRSAGGKRPATARPTRTESAHIPASRIKVLGCEIQDPHLLQPNQIARIVLLYWSLRLPPLLLVLVAVYQHTLKTIRAQADKLQLNFGELITVAVCVALFIVLAVILIPRRRRRGGRSD